MNLVSKDLVLMGLGDLGVRSSGSGDLMIWGSEEHLKVVDLEIMWIR